MGLSAAGGPGAGNAATAACPGHDVLSGVLSGLIAGIVDDPDEVALVLLRRFGSLSAALEAHGSKEVAGCDPTGRLATKLMRLAALCNAVLRSDIDEALRIGSIDALAQLLRHDMIDLPVETFRVFFLRADNAVIEDREMWTGTVDCVQVHPREIVRAAVETRAAAVILAHNHPRGPAAPSEGDVRSTRGIVDACALLGIAVHDHVIIARDGFFSMRAAGLLPVPCPAPAASWTLAA